MPNRQSLDDTNYRDSTAFEKRCDYQLMPLTIDGIHLDFFSVDGPSHGASEKASRMWFTLIKLNLLSSPLNYPKEGMGPSKVSLIFLAPHLKGKIRESFYNILFFSFCPSHNNPVIIWNWGNYLSDRTTNILSKMLMGIGPRSEMLFSVAQLKLLATSRRRAIKFS